MATSNISCIFRKAKETDIERIWQIIGQAKSQMKRLGSQQWDESYPTIEHICQDIQNGNGYVICREDQVIAYGVISFDGEPAYKNIEGKWSNDLPYVIVHRLAVADEMKRQGMAKQFMLQAEEVSRKKGVYNFRVDTKYDNAYMLRLIDTLEFKYCGEVYYRNNSARKAFEKTIRPHSYSIGISDYTIREATLEDAVPVFEAIDKNREDLRIWLPFVDGLKNVADEQGFLQSVLAIPYEQRDPVYVLEQKGTLCGLAGFHFSDIPNQRTEIGYWLLPAYRGKGIATHAVRYLCRQAVRERNMNRIQIRCAVGNSSSNAIPKRLGFTLEGTEREGELLVSGEYVNINVYSILKKEIEQWNKKSN